MNSSEYMSNTACRKLPRKRIVENAPKVLRNSLLKRKMSKNLQLHVKQQDYLFFSFTSSFLKAIRKLQG